jgi:hypothetical protein
MNKVPSDLKFRVIRRATDVLLERSNPDSPLCFQTSELASVSFESYSAFPRRPAFWLGPSLCLLQHVSDSPPRIEFD